MSKKFYGEMLFTLQDKSKLINLLSVKGAHLIGLKY